MSLFFSFRELAFFYPDFVAPTIVQRRKKKRLQRTLALIRPDALKTRKGMYPYMLQVRLNLQVNSFPNQVNLNCFKLDQHILTKERLVSLWAFYNIWLFQFLDSILKKIEEAGFTIAMSKEMTLSKEQAEEFYAEHKDEEFFETLVTNMTRFVLIMIMILYINNVYWSFVIWIVLWMKLNRVEINP